MEWWQANKDWIGLAMMPVTYGVIGWFTNVVALRMTFYPLRFVGIPPFLGWQGIVPKKATGLALKAVNLLTEKVFRIEDVFAKIEPAPMVRQFQPIVSGSIRPAIETMLDETGARLNKSEAESVEKRAVKHCDQRMAEILKEAESDAAGFARVFNFKNVVLRSITGNNVHRIVEIFLKVGSKEFRFIENSGFIFGGLLGIIQIILWQYFPYLWTLPLQGVFVGYITNDLALRMIFSPKKPVRVGPFVLHGLFLKRQDMVSREYAAMFGQYVLTPRNIMEELLYRRIARVVIDTAEADIIEWYNQNSPEDSEEMRRKLDEAKKTQIAALMDRFSESAGTIEKILVRVMNIEKRMYDNLRNLPPDEFEPILRNAFQEDEYILILFGAILGGLAGALQILLMI